MLSLFQGLKAFIKRPSCIIDNVGFQLHYKATVLILVGFSILVTATQYFGDPINCMSPSDVSSKVMDMYCWIHTTFSIAKNWQIEVGPDGVPYPGLGHGKKTDEKVYHAYYQWVSFVLCIQAFFFYLPHFIWKAKEGSTVKSLTLKLDNPVISREQREKNCELLATYLARNMRNHDSYFSVYAFTEILNFVNVIFQMYVVNKFLGGVFYRYGWEVLKFTEWSPEVRYDPMLKVFPRMAKCTFHDYGPSGDIRVHDAICLLPINILNEKVYIFLWFWFWFLFFASVLSLMFRALTIMVPYSRVVITQRRCYSPNRDQLEAIIKRLSIGDWFLLDLLSKNMDTYNFHEFVVKYYEKLRNTRCIDSFEHMK